MSENSQIFHGPNLGYVVELYERYQRDPGSVDEATRRFFQTWQPPPSLELPVAAGAVAPGGDLRKAIAAANLAQAIRTYGYMAARLDPLGSPPVGDRELEPDFHGLSEPDLHALPPELVSEGLPDRPGDAFEAIQSLRRIYSGAIGYDYGHMHLAEERRWLYQSAESGRFRPQLEPETAHGLLERLIEVESFERFLHRIYPGKTRFSIEGLDMLVPMLDELVTQSVEGGICAVLIGISHRGRLNVLAHVLQKPYAQILAEFKDPRGRASTWDALGWTGDVKYHMGGLKKPAGSQMDLLIHVPSNPSHLEQIDPVILGMARAADSVTEAAGPPKLFFKAALPVLIHGDASFSGQGVVAETFNLAQLPAYNTGGSVHIIVDNQLGFTATAKESRSSLFASDLAKGFEAPIVHVNADEPLACIEAVRTAFAYREEFGKDFVVDLIGYRRYGHNEGDEPRFTQPQMYARIEAHPSVGALWAERLTGLGWVSKEEVEARARRRMDTLQEINQNLKPEEELEEPLPKPPPSGAAQKVETAVPLKTLDELNQALLTFPQGFHPNPKLKNAIQRRREALSRPDQPGVDWATAEELALASILAEGIAIRFGGEDTIRGTFSQRHAGFYDVEDGQPYFPLQSIPQAKASFEIFNSALTEMAGLSFEFGYNVQSPDRLAIWEAQYGDFIDIGQVVIDEFIASGRAKWGLTPSLVLLLPHGNEGQGPDHSSGRMERFLNLAGETNMRIVQPTTAAQYFHLLRRQARLLKTDPLPLIVFTPKGLLRHPMTASRPAALSEGGWQPVIEDGRADNRTKDARAQVRELILCSGRIYVDLVASEHYPKSPEIAISRLEQLYPFPKGPLDELLNRYPKLERLLWVQEEPSNMGAWNFLRPRLRALAGKRLGVEYIGRPESSSPAEGSTTLYRLNQEALVEQAFQPGRREKTSSVVIEEG